MIHIIDGVEYTSNPYLCPIVAEALVLGEFVTVIDDFGVIVYEGSSQSYAYSLLNSFQTCVIEIDGKKQPAPNPKNNIIYLDDYRK